MCIRDRDNIRVEDLGKADVLPGNADPAIQAAQTVSEGQTFTVQTNTEFFEPGNPGKITNLKTTLSAPEAVSYTHLFVEDQYRCK